MESQIFEFFEKVWNWIWLVLAIIIILIASHEAMSFGIFFNLAYNTNIWKNNACFENEVNEILVSSKEVMNPILLLDVIKQSSIFHLIFWSNNFFLCGNKFLTGTYLANIKRILKRVPGSMVSILTNQC